MAKNYTDLWLNYSPVQSDDAGFFKKISIPSGADAVLSNAVEELKRAASGMFGITPETVLADTDTGIVLKTDPGLDV